MRTPLGRSLAAAGVAAIVALALSACATGPNPTPGASGQTDDDGVAEQIEIGAAWLDGGRMIGIVTSGSSTCVPTAGEVAVEVDGSLTVTLEEPDADTPCTADYGPRVSLVELPEGVDPSQDLSISVQGQGGDGNVELAGIDGLTIDGPSDMTPSAGWTDVEGTFAVLLWGSSGCKEYITSTAVTGAASVTASLSGIPADKVCTADIVPNAVLATVDGLTGVADVELTLTAAGAEPVTVPILGVNAP